MEAGVPPGAEVRIGPAWTMSATLGFESAVRQGEINRISNASMSAERRRATRNAAPVRALSVIGDGPCGTSPSSLNKGS